MGFCDMCGAHLDIYDTVIDLRKTRMKKYYTLSLSFVCNCCYNKLKKYDAGNKRIFKGMNFATPEIEIMFRNQKEIDEQQMKNYLYNEKIWKK